MEDLEKPKCLIIWDGGMLSLVLNEETHWQDIDEQSYSGCSSTREVCKRGSKGTAQEEREGKDAEVVKKLWDAVLWTRGNICLHYPLLATRSKEDSQ